MCSRRIHPTCIAALLIGSLACAPRALAQATVDSKAAAEALFDDGLALMRKGDFAAACIKLEQSSSIDHGIGTMLYLAECYEKSGRTASAWAMFRQAASEAAASGESQRAEAGRQRAEKLTPTLSKLTVTVTAPAPPGLELTRNGAAVPNALWGTPVPVDPGDQRVDAHAPGYLPWSGTVRIAANADAQTLTVPALTPQPVNELPVAQSSPAPAPAAAPLPAAAPAPVTAADTTATSTSGSTQRITGIVIGAVGLVGIGVGSVFGLKAISKNNDAKEHCPGGGASCDDTQGVSLTNDAQSAARLANVFVIAGAVLAAAGVVTYLMAPPDSEPAIAVSADAHAVRATVGGGF
jgi:serine/threonine-protein kinase